MPRPEPAATAAPQPLVRVQVEGQWRQLPAGGDLASLLADLGHAPEAVATAVNGEFVPRALRAAHRLRDGDRVSCFKPIVGG